LKKKKTNGNFAYGKKETSVKKNSTRLVKDGLASEVEALWSNGLRRKRPVGWVWMKEGHTKNR